MLLNILFCLNVTPGSVSVLAQCMGAAMTLRAYAKDPTPFSGKFVFHNATIGTWLPAMDAAVHDGKAKICAYHTVDQDHMVEAVCFKNLTRLSNSCPNLVSFSVNCEELIFETTGPLPTKKLFSRAADNSVSFKTYSPLGFDKITYHIHSALPRPNPPPPPPNVTAILDPSLDAANSRFQVYTRVRPLLAHEAPSTTTFTDTTITVNESSFTFAAVLDNRARLVETALPTVCAVVEGRANGVIFAYGQTGSGKTFTINELIASIQLVMGAVPFEAQYMQIYNDCVYDMFGNNAQLSRGEELQTLQFGVRVNPNIHPGDLLKELDLANAQRAVSSTAMNAGSSRSHSLLYIKPQGGKTLCVVDLAGSERVKKSNVQGKELEEAKHINSSLAALVRVLNCRIDKTARHVPVRDCRLTMALEDVFLDSRCNVSMYACISPAVGSTRESYSTLTFAAGCTYVGAKKKKKSTGRGQRTVLGDCERAVLKERERATRGALEEGVFVDGIYARGREGEGEGAVNVVLLHYYGGECVKHGSTGMWGDGDLDEMKAALGGQGVDARIIAIDFPGHGRSNGLASCPARPESKFFHEAGGGVESVIKVMDYLGCDERTVVVGFDWGGGVGIALCEGHEERVGGLVAWNASYRMEEGGEDRRWTRGVKEREVVWTESMWFTKGKAKCITELCGIEKEVKMAKKGGKSDAAVLGAVVKVAKAVGRNGNLSAALAAAAASSFRCFISA